MRFTISACWIKRILFLIVSHAIAFAEGYYLISWGLDWLFANGGHISISCATVDAGVLELLALSFTAAVYAYVTVFLVCQSVEMFLAIEL